MRYGVILLWEDDLGTFRTRVQRAEEQGYDVLGVGDSPGVYRELAVSMTAAAVETHRMAVASTVTVPVGRHPAVVASSFSALAELSGNRVIYGVGAGGSATGAMGLGPTGLTAIKRHSTAVRRLLEGESTEWEGVTVPGLRHPRRVPMYLSAYGPATRRLAGASFDGVILASGPSAGVLEQFVGEVRDGAREADRDPDDVDIWVMSRASVRDDREEALIDLKANLASAGSFGLRSPAQMATVPPELKDRIRELQARYDTTHHVVWDGPNSRLIDELGLTEYLASRFAVVGTPEECRAQAATIEKLGVSTLLVPAVDRDPDGLMTRFAEAVL